MKLSLRVKLIVGISAVMVMIAGLAWTASIPFVSLLPRNDLVGTWVINILGNEIEATFSSDGIYSERTGGITMNGTYSVSDNRLTAEIPGYGTTISEFEIKGNELTSKTIYAEINGVDVASTMQSMTFT